MKNIVGRYVMVSTTSILGHDADKVREVQCKIIENRGVILGKESYNVQDHNGNIAHNICFGGGILRFA